MSIGRPRGGKNRCHSKDFKMQIVERCLSGEGTEVLAKEFELSGSMIRKWVRMFNQEGASALENRKKPGNPLGGIYRKKNLSEVDQNSHRPKYNLQS